jgi:methylated-DNA-[protein]-cysteine S-methyltransferase
MPLADRTVPVAVATLAGPRGPLHVAATERGVVAAEDGCTRDAFEAGLRRRLGAGLVDAAAASACLARSLPAVERIANGQPVAPGAVAIDLDDRPVFDRHVLLAVAAIPWGQTASYGEIARRAGYPRAARAVGGAVRRNPISFVVPCHRVIAADGTIGGYGGDGPTGQADAIAYKRALLLREGVTVADPGR